MQKMRGNRMEVKVVGMERIKRKKEIN